VICVLLPLLLVRGEGIRDAGAKQFVHGVPPWCMRRTSRHPRRWRYPSAVAPVTALVCLWWMLRMRLLLLLLLLLGPGGAMRGSPPLRRHAAGAATAWRIMTPGRPRHVLRYRHLRLSRRWMYAMLLLLLLLLWPRWRLL
jgi:hypothetical protein